VLRTRRAQGPILVERGTDQADGLRRLFGGARTRVLDVVSGSGGVGRTSVAVNLGAALARSGRNTLLVDFVAEPSESRAHRYLGMTPVAHRVLLPVSKGYGVMTLGHREWIETGPLPAGVLGPGTAMDRDATRPDWVLVNGASIEPVVATDDGGREVLIVLSGDARSITEAYALIKRMSANDRRCCYCVLVNRVHSQAAAHQIFRNMAQAARGYLDVELALIGFVPADPSIERAAVEGVNVFERDPSSPAALAFVRLADAIGNRAVAGLRPGDQTLNSAVAAGAM